MTDATQPSPRPQAGRTGWATAACYFALVGIAFSLAHFLWPTPLLFSLFMIVGQGAFGMAMLLYAIAIVIDLKHQKVL